MPLSLLFSCKFYCQLVSRAPPRRRFRNNRSCYVSGPEEEDDLFYRTTIFENPFYLTIMVLLAIFFLLLFLGLVKGIIGLLCSKKIGIAGLYLLIDLPRTLYEYDESNLKHRCIVYDVGGWPVHPDTKERSVRVVPRKTEFCLNMVFFLAYPLSLIINLCSLCCCIRTVRNTDDECACLNTTQDVYRDQDLKEHQDTKYVINIMKQSKMNLKCTK